MARLGFIEASNASIPRWTFAALLGGGFGLNAAGNYFYSCGVACEAVGDLGAPLTLYVFPYSLFWLLVPAVHDRRVVDLLVLVVCFASYLVLRRFAPPKLSLPQTGVILVGWGLSSVAASLVYLVSFLIYYGVNRPG
ncbi:hypothetical protein BH10PSE5_BH10PSE5_23460 [soil metagenome]